MHAEVADLRSLNVPLVANLPSHDGATDEPGDWHKRQDTVQHTRFADLLGDFTRRVTRHQVRDDAHAAVAEAAEKTVLKLSRHDDETTLVLVDGSAWSVVCVQLCIDQSPVGHLQQAYNGVTSHVYDTVRCGRQNRGMNRTARSS